MLFCYPYQGRYQILKHSYLSNYKIGYGVFSTVKKDNKLSPSTPSGIDLSKYNTYKKIHQEYLERFRIAHNIDNYSKVKCFNPLTKQIIIHDRSVLAYGFNDKYGVMDTTGTASGLPSKKLKEKALLELIEKNESMLIWYLGKGYNVVIDEDIKKLINSIGFYSEDVYIFCSNNLCNLTTFVVFLFYDKKIVSTGISIDKNFKNGLFKALLEAKLLESIYRDSIISPYKSFEQKEYEKAYEIVQNLSNEMENRNIVEDVQQDIVLSSWITSIEFAVLNIKTYQDYITIRCFSKELLNSIPNEQNVLQSFDKKIFKIYCLDKQTILKKSPCVIL